ncbi:MAG: hypothetical protein IPH44_38995 [Myxococcales bacterium]|nr:hypothetical protein [Myxococcales bacterium]
MRTAAPSATTGTAATVALALSSAIVRRTTSPATSVTSTGDTASAPLANSRLAPTVSRAGPGGSAAKRNTPSGALTVPATTPSPSVSASVASSGAPSSRTVTSRPASRAPARSPARRRRPG